MKMRKCKQCGETKPLTPEYYHRDKDCKDGFRLVCKACRYGKSGVKKKKAKEGYKICSKCGKEKPLNIKYWSKNKSTKDGFHTICKSCRNKTDKVILPIDESDGFRICTKCKIKKPLTDDYYKKDKQNKKGYSTICRACISKRERIKRNTYKEDYEICRICRKEYKLNEENFPRNRYFENGFSDICNNCLKVKKIIEKQDLKDGYKFCRDCGKQFPKTKEFFFKRNNGYDPVCKECRGYEFGSKQNVMNRKTIDGYKYCTECGKLLKLTTKNFYRSNGNEDGFTSSCKKCLKVKAHLNIEQTRKYKRFAQQRRRSRKKKLPHSFTENDWAQCKTFFNNKCCYCGKMTYDLQQDHFIPISKGGGYTKDNIVPACKSCNISKNNSEFLEWYLKQDFYSEKREEKILKYLKTN